MEGEMGKVKRLYLAKYVGKEFYFKSNDKMEPIVFVLKKLDDDVVF